MEDPKNQNAPPSSPYPASKSPPKDDEGPKSPISPSGSLDPKEAGLIEEPSLARSSLTKVEEEKTYRLLPKPIRSNVNITWERQGKLKKIKVKKRIQKVEERKQLKKQWDTQEAIKNANKPPPEVAAKLDMRTPQEKMLAAKKKLQKMQTMGNMMKEITMRKTMMEKVSWTLKCHALCLQCST